MKKIHLILFAFLSVGLFAQNNSPALISFVKSDRVLLRWAAPNAELFLDMIQNGSVIQRIEGSTQFENNNEIKEYVIPDFNERKKTLLVNADENVKSQIEYLDEMLKTADAQAIQMNFFFLMLGASSDKNLAKILGCYFEDVEITKKEYSYRVLLKNKTVSSNIISLNSGIESKNDEMTELTASSRPKLKQAYLKWEAEQLQSAYGAYNIERSTDSINFEKRNKNPYYFLKSQDEANKTFCDFADTNVQEGQTYFYRVIGINHFGDFGNSSNIVKVYVPKSLYGEVRVDSTEAIENKRIISGHFVSGTSKDHVVKYVLFRSDSILGPYSLLEEKITKEDHFRFEATVPVSSGDRYYYKVAAIGTDNDTVYSYPKYIFTLDQIPPSTPLGLRGVINDSGVVKLNWQLNPENDIRGYRVFRANSLNEEFVEVTNYFVTEDVFYDTLRLDNLTKEVYYKIAAVDLNYNNSPRCEPVLILKPDTIPPVPGHFTKFEINDKGVFLSWRNSSSSDLKESQLIRVGKSSSEIIFIWTDTTVNFIDTTGIPGQEYQYVLVSIDKSANQSNSEPLHLFFETGKRDGVSKIQTSVDRELKQIKLNWVLPKGEIYSVQIYRAKADEKYVLYKTIREQNSTEFIDANVQINNEYRYKIKVVFKDGTSSVLSDEVSVTY